MVSLRKQSPQDGAEPDPTSSQKSGRRFKLNAFNIMLMIAFPVAAIAGGAFLLSRALAVTFSCGIGPEIEGQITLGSLGRAQQAHWSETKSFAPSIASLELDIAEKTDNYTFAMEGEGDRRFYSADANLEERSFVGAIFAVEPFADPTNPSAEMVETVTIVCGEKWDAETDLATVKHLKPSLDGNMPVCHPDTELETRTPYFPLDTDATVSLQ